MFNSRSRSADEPTTGNTTIIGAGTQIAGNMQSKGDIRIDGTLIGNLSGMAKILIGPEGKIEGDVEGMQADVLGAVKGKVKIKDLLQLRGKAHIDGDIYTGKLQVEPTVTFNGRCHMGANVVELNTEIANAANQ